MEKTQTKLTFYRGLNTIGGVIMAVEYGNERVLLELGLACEPDRNYFTANFNQHSGEVVHAGLKLKYLPAIPGLYSKVALKDFPLLSSEEDPRHTTVFISHLHLDHMALIGQAGNDVDIYLSNPALRIFRTLQIVEPIAQLRDVPYKTLTTQPVQLGKITVTPFLLNTEGYQDYSFYVETPDLKLHYTGDLALHHCEAQRTLDEMEVIKNKHPDILVVETTNLMDGTLNKIYGQIPKKIEPDKDLPAGFKNEMDADKYSASLIMETSGAQYLNFYRRELANYPYFVAWAKKGRRRLVFEPQSAYLYRSFFNLRCDYYLPDNDYYNDHASWTNKLKPCKLITKIELREHPDKYLIENSYPNLRELFDLPKGTYFHYDGEPIGAFDSRFKPFKDFIEQRGFTYRELSDPAYLPHVYPNQLQYYVDQIGAKYTIPTHGFNPERLVPDTGKQFLPISEITYVYQEGKLRLL